MKKAKVIIPALAALAFSTVASVTGTVAWFTSQSSATLNTSYFTVAGLKGDLACSYIAGVGTEVSGSGSTQSIAARSGLGLTHGSFNPTTNAVWTKSVYSTNYIHHEGADIATYSAAIAGKTDTALEEAKTTAETPFRETSGGKLYNAFTWQIKFMLGDGTSFDYGAPINLYFDFRNNPSDATIGSKATLDSGTLTDSVANVARGFRIAFVNEAQTEVTTKVWSPLQGKTMLPKAEAAPTAKNSCYVKNATTTEDYVTAANGNLIYMGENEEAESELTYIDGDEGTKTRSDYLGEFNATNKGVLTLTCVAWYEGCDDTNVINSANAFPKVMARMCFYIRSNKTIV